MILRGPLFGWDGVGDVGLVLTNTDLLLLYDYDTRARGRARITGTGRDGRGTIVRAVVSHHDVHRCGPRTIGHSAVRVVLSYNVGTPGKRGGRS